MRSDSFLPGQYQKTVCQRLIRVTNRSECVRLCCFCGKPRRAHGMPESTSNRETCSDSTVTAVQSGLAAVRLHEARRFLEQFEPGAEVLLLGASRGSVDDLARAISVERGATFGLHRLSFTQLAARLAALELASRERAPTTALGHEAV